MAPATDVARPRRHDRPGPLLEMRHQRDNAVASCAAEEIDAFERRQPPAEHLDQARHGRSARASGSPRRIDSRDHTLYLFRESAVRLLTRAPELLDQGIIRKRLHAVGRKHADVSSCAFDLRRQPLEVLARRGRVGEHVDRLLDWHCANLLQAAPRTHAQVGRRRGQLVHEHQPAVCPAVRDGRHRDRVGRGGWRRHG